MDSVQHAFNVLLGGDEVSKNAIEKNHMFQVLISWPADNVSRTRLIYKTRNDQPWMRVN